MDIVSRVLLRYAQEKKADYVYDPKHENRPHSGSGWHKTEKGWSNVEQRGSFSEDTYYDSIARDLVTSNRMEVRKNIARDSDMRPDILVLLSKDKESLVRAEVAQNKNTPSETIDELSKDEDEFVRRGVAMNRMTSPETLDRLSYDEVSGIRSHVAENKNTSSDTLVRLSEDKNSIVRDRVARNRNTPIGVVQDMKENDPDEDVREMASLVLKDRSRN